MRKTLLTGLVVGLLMIVMAVPALASNGKSEDSNGRAGSMLTIIVTGGDDDPSNDLVFDSIVKTSLPMAGPFQELTAVGADHFTDYGPGDEGYVGGRWWVDANGNGTMDADDVFFICPLLGPGQPVG
jgi:hypothetical protein